MTTPNPANRVTLYPTANGAPRQKVRPVPSWFAIALLLITAVVVYQSERNTYPDLIAKMSFYFAFASIYQVASYRMDLVPGSIFSVLALVFFGTGCAAIGGGCCLGVLIIPLIWFLPWTVLTGLSVAFVAIAIIDGVSGRKKRDIAYISLSEQVQVVGYPFEFLFSVSRRFTSEAATQIYESELRPAVQREGKILECWYAGNSTQDTDYWMARMSLVFDVSDVHLLLDLEASPATRWEIAYSKKRVLRPNPAVSRLLFDPHHPILMATSLPFCIWVSDSGPEFDFNHNMRVARIRLATEADHQRLSERIRLIVNILKALKYRKAVELREGQRSIVHTHWYAPSYQHLKLFLQGRMAVVSILGSKDTEAIRSLFGTLPGLVTRGIQSVNWLQSLTYNVETRGGVPGLSRLFKDLKSSFIWSNLALDSRARGQEHTGINPDRKQPGTRRSEQRKMRFVSTLISCVSAMFMVIPVWLGLHWLCWVTKRTRGRFPAHT